MSENEKKSENIISFKEKIYLRNDYGPISFGYCCGTVVSWSCAGARDLLVCMIYGEVLLYPGKDLSGEEFTKEPLVLCRSPYCTNAYPVDWNKDGKEDLISISTDGFIHLFERRGEYPDLHFEYAGPLKDSETGLLFNLPFENPNHVLNDLEGYTDIYFYHPFVQILRYPSGNPESADLVIGSWSGNLWWLRDISDKGETAKYTGIRYVKPESTAKGIHRLKNDYRERYGYEYVKPEKLYDECGEPFLLGEGVDGEYFAGSNAKPVLYRNKSTESDDLLVYTGSAKTRTFYLKRANSKYIRKPVFRNLGEVAIDGFRFDKTCQRASFAVYENDDGWNDLLLINIDMHIVKLKNQRLERLEKEIPGFAFDRVLSGKDSKTGGIYYTGILNDKKNNRRYLLECNYYFFELREIIMKGDRLRLSSIRIPLEDQGGIFKTGGETDPNLKEWGWNTIVRWNYDSSDRQHLVVGADTGYIYILKDDGTVGNDGRFRYRSKGPLKDKKGQVIRIHNRACPAGIDLNGDGTEDLIIAGVSYQCGIKTDPEPGGGIYYCLNKGMGDDGYPVFEDDFKLLKIKGCRYNFEINEMIKMQSIDIDGDGEKEVIIAAWSDNHKARIFKTLKDEIGLEYTGKTVENYCLAEHLMDIDDDGQPEFVFAGDEDGFGWYYKIALDVKS